MRRRGVLKSWDSARGFGWIRPEDQSPDLFVHINELSSAMPRPEEGTILEYEVGTDNQGRSCAVKVTAPSQSSSTANPARSPGRFWIPLRIAIVLAFFAIFSGITIFWRAPTIVAIVYLVASLVNFFVYAIDKSAARVGTWRTSENTLHLISLAGGWPGALLAQQFLRHKNRKISFQIIFWLTVIINFGLLIYFCSPWGNWIWSRS